jgi:hypothetical protein
MGFWSALGAGLEDYAKQRAMKSPMGRAISGGMSRYRADQGQGQAPDLDRSIATSPDDSLGGMSAQSTPQEQAPSASDSLAGLTPELMASGRLVTSPTVAMIGEKGPEAVVPLNNNPMNKVSGLNATMLPGVRSRYRHVTGPNALRRESPVRNDLPLKPNTAIR